MLFGLAAFGCVGVLLAGAWILVLRRRNAQKATDADTREELVSAAPPAARKPATEEAPLAVRSCPVCLTEYPSKNLFCVKDGAELMDGPPSGPFSQGMICPTCRRGYSHDASFCPDDADELVPYGLYGAASSTRPPQRVDSRKICPECGQRHTSAHTFCGDDGAELVVVN